MSNPRQSASQQRVDTSVPSRHHKQGMAVCEHLLVDGYNVIHAWPEMKEALREGTDVSVQRLAEQVRILHDMEGIMTTLVFDGKGDTNTFEHPGGQVTFTLLFAAAGISADALIEQMVARSPKPEDLVVVSRDNMVRETIFILGARPMTPEELADWVDAARKRQTRNLEQRTRNTDKDFGNRLTL